jgi:phosphate transport system substrate-binding protein
VTVTRFATLTAVAAALLLASKTAPAGAQTVKSSDPIVLHGAGSTFASLLYKKWIETYRTTYPNVSITYDAVGSGEGIARFIAETVDFAGSDLLMSDTEIAKVRNGVSMAPTTAGMIVLAYNLPG